MNKDTKKFAIVSALMAGVGYIAGILTAPKSGKETREDVKNTAIKAKTEAEKELKKLHSEVTKQLERAKSLGQRLHKDHKKDFDLVVEKANTAKDKAKELLTNLHDGDAEDKDLKKAVNEITSAIDSLKNYIDHKI